MTHFICIICKHNKSELLSKKVRDSDKHKVVKCKKCLHTQLFPIPLISDDKLFYDNDLQAKNINNLGSISEMRKKSIVDTLRRFNFVKKLVTKNSKILEIGSGYGFFLESMNKSNFDITGIEISKDRRKISKSISNTKILDINILEKTPSISKMNLIAMFHVLEHISNPIEYLKKNKTSSQKFRENLN